MADNYRESYVPNNTTERMPHAAAIDSRHRYNTPKPFTFATMLSAAVRIALSYVVAIIIVAYFIAQAAETVTFILNTDFRVLWKLLWIFHITALGLAACFIAYLVYAVDRDGPFIDNQQLQWL